jgi:ketosteroid isomerase-like protein
VEIVRRVLRLWSEGVERQDSTALRTPFEEGLIAPEFAFTPVQEVVGTSGRTFVGVDGLRDFGRAWVEEWRDWSFVPEEPIDASDDRVVAAIDMSAIGRSSGAPVSIRFGAVFTLRDGQVVDRHDYADLAEALKAVGFAA